MYKKANRFMTGSRKGPGYGPPKSKTAGKPLSKAEQKAIEEAKAKKARKLLRSFVSQCATAYAYHKLTATYPIPPESLRWTIKAAAGNVTWLASDQTYRRLFVEAYCHVRGEQILYEKVWKEEGVRTEPSGVTPNQRAALADHEKNKTNEARRKRPTAFERAVQVFLIQYADASVRGLPRPRPPAEVRQRYSGNSLRQWEKNILGSGLFKSAMRKARETNVSQSKR
ncbi:hypothetical protein JQ574_17540 [Bradyrhizobium sp. AUGA SZCCT0158]|uniref:hypothetical protein n=1 Tax=Bradyrhizobium sp. AUGA SZCCT0158 TaxID=2807661 RepID=UPI001BABFB74|nr:hypothetical protein [Bradyrhizobium sp. AUGA SZCCT0158]MBR1197802.1 hypothetical protein [Bradyrhizobium sp. AUGA SZCCT0158]